MRQKGWSPFLMVILPFSAVLTGWEMNNKYTINNTMGQQIFFAKEGRLSKTFCIIFENYII
jgi:hypothetical protein